MCDVPLGQDSHALPDSLLEMQLNFTNFFFLFRFSDVMNWLLSGQCFPIVIFGIYYFFSINVLSLSNFLAFCPRTEKREKEVWWKLVIVWSW